MGRLATTSVEDPLSSKFSFSSTIALRPACFSWTRPDCATFSTKSRNDDVPYVRSEKVESSWSSVLLSRPICGETSRSDRIFSAPHDGERLRDGRGGGGRCRSAAPGGRAAASRQVLIGDELVAVALEDSAGERPAADDEHFLIVFVELFAKREEVTVAADDHVRVDMRVCEGHFEGIERQVDVGAILVAAGRQVALHQADGVLREVPAVFTRARPVGVGNLGDHLAALL